MKNIFTVLAAVLIWSAGASAQAPDLNLELVSKVNYPQGCNDIWGYVAPDGTEYAILGTRTGTAVLNLADPANPVEVAFIPGSSSVWRDMKSWGEFVYVTCDQGDDGLLVIDMTGAPGNVTWEFWKPELTANGSSATLHTCHNLYIDEEGYCYLAGCNVNGGGPIILDVATTPGQPIYVGASDARYSHDVYVRRDTMYSSDINNGFFSVIDVTDRSAPVTMAIQETSSRFTHNSWLSDDGRYLFTTDERPNAYVDAYDISDLTDIRQVGKFRPLATEGTGVIPHNTHYKDGFLVVSWYTDGVVVIDANRPENMIEVGSYDTYEPLNTGFNGCWGAYPWLPSGLVLASDIDYGLFVLRPDYVRAAYLEGVVRSAADGQAQSNVSVQITSNRVNRAVTNNIGVYRTGLPVAGSYEVTFEKAGFRTKVVTAELRNGEVTILDVALEPLRRIRVLGTVKEKETGVPVSGPYVHIRSGGETREIRGDQDGIFDLEILNSDIEVIAGAWGYRYTSLELLSVDDDLNLELLLDKGYQDDFIFDYNWEVSGTAEAGQWELGVPEATFLDGVPANPGADLPADFGDKCYVTGLQAGDQVGSFDLDNGTAVLRSPVMDLTTYEEPVLQYYRWFFNGGGFGTPNDTLIVYLTNGTTEVELERVSNNTEGWKPSPQFRIRNLIDLTNEMSVIFYTSDLASSGHVVEAAVDGFVLTDEGRASSVDQETVAQAFRVQPNPSSGMVDILPATGTAVVKSLELIDLHGKLIRYVSGADMTQGRVDFGTLPQGMYMLRIQSSSGRVELHKLMLMH